MKKVSSLDFMFWYSAFWVEQLQISVSVSSSAVVQLQLTVLLLCCLAVCLIFEIQGFYQLSLFSGLFDLRMIDQTAAQVFAAKPLVGQYGNYSLIVQAQDRGFPPNSVMSKVDVCVTDFNDHAPLFVSPSVNLTIRVPEVKMVYEVCFTSTRYQKSLCCLLLNILLLSPQVAFICIFLINLSIV